MSLPVERKIRERIVNQDMYEHGIWDVMEAFVEDWVTQVGSLRELGNK